MTTKVGRQMVGGVAVTEDGGQTIDGTVNGRDIAVDGAKLDLLKVKNPVVPGHVRAGNMQIVDGSNSFPPLLLSAVIPRAVNVKIGPNGSGATYEYGGLDVVPANAKIILFDVYVSLWTIGIGTPIIGTVRLYASQDPSPSALKLKYSIWKETRGDMSQPIEVVVDESNTFYVRWEDLQTSHSVVHLAYKGFITDD